MSSASHHCRKPLFQLKKTLDNFKDKGRSNGSLFLYGHGDGGQGATYEMCENVKRLEDVNGLPR